MSINTWTNDFTEASVVRMTPQNKVSKGLIQLIISSKTTFPFVRTRFLVLSLFTSNFVRDKQNQ